MELAQVDVSQAPPSGQDPLPGPSVARPNNGGDYWDMNAPNIVAAPNIGDSDFGDLGDASNVSVGSGPAKTIATTVLLILVAVVGYGAYLQYVEERDPIQELMALINGEEPNPIDEPRPGPRKKMKAVATKPEAPVKTNGRKPVEGNPYWHLPNAILGSQTPPERLWTAEEEETWRAGLAHRFSYQRWKTVMDVREMRLKGSEAILWDAMQDKKFWTRMYAAVVAEFDVPVSLQSIDAAMQNARSELIADFFERFIKKCNPGQCFMLRQAIRVMDAKGRLIALQGIARSKDGLRDLYLTAATLDPDRHVKKWIRSYLDWQPIDPDKYNELMPIAQGTEDGERLIASAKKGKRALQIGGKAGAKGSKEPELNVEEDLDKELEQLDKDTGDVEIYEPDNGPAVKDDGDGDTFEYAE